MQIYVENFPLTLKCMHTNRYTFYTHTYTMNMQITTATTWASNRKQQLEIIILINKTRVTTSQQQKRERDGARRKQSVCIQTIRLFFPILFSRVSSIIISTLSSKIIAAQKESTC